MSTAPTPRIDRRAVMTGMAGIAAAPASRAWAQISLTDPSIVKAVQEMKPGDYIWAPEVAPWPSRRSSTA